jgi:hypothetical protein
LRTRSRQRFLAYLIADHAVVKSNFSRDGCSIRGLDSHQAYRNGGKPALKLGAAKTNNTTSHHFIANLKQISLLPNFESAEKTKTDEEQAQLNDYYVNGGQKIYQNRRLGK